LGGCNPLTSFKADSCKPLPICQNNSFSFGNVSRILTNPDEYDGDPAKYDWIMEKGNISTSNGDLALYLTETNGGTRISSTRYVHYGTISAKLKTGRWAGVVTAFITMSSIKDEIDWEFPGKTVTEAQTNYFWHGIIPASTQGDTTKGLTDTYQNYHEYTIDWKPDALSFLVDGKNVRTVKASDAPNNHYPTTPSRVQLSIWPAGINSSAKGTVEWAGGMIDWNDPDYKAAGGYAIYVSSVSVQCADPSPPSGNVTSYIYGSSSNNNTDPEITFSGATTALKDSELSSGAKKAKGGLTSGTLFKVLIIVGAIVAIIIIALILLAIKRKLGKKKVAAPALGGFLASKGQSYQPLQNPSANASVESHKMHYRY